MTCTERSYLAFVLHLAIAAMASQELRISLVLLASNPSQGFPINCGSLMEWFSSPALLGAVVQSKTG